MSCHLMTPGIIARIACFAANADNVMYARYHAPTHVDANTPRNDIAGSVAAALATWNAESVSARYGIDPMDFTGAPGPHPGFATMHDYVENARAVADLMYRMAGTGRLSDVEAKRLARDVLSLEYQTSEADSDDARKALDWIKTLLLTQLTREDV